MRCGNSKRLNNSVEMDFVCQKNLIIKDYLSEIISVLNYKWKSSKNYDSKKEVKICIAQISAKHSTIEYIKYFEKLFRDEKVNILVFPEMFSKKV